MDDLREHQLICTEALTSLAEICDRHNIKYYLLAGSCLGAVRHKGFIPWDDDIDVGIRNEDYEKLQKAIRKELSSKFKWIDNDASDSYPRLYGKILYDRSACVDVFRLIRLPKDKKKQKRLWRTRKILYKMYYRKFGRPKMHWESTGMYILSKFMSLFISCRKIVELSRWNENRYRNEELGDYVNLYSIYSMSQEMIKKEWLDKPSKVVFEGKEFLTVSDTDAYLTKLYGDYMTPPDDTNRKLRHINVVFGSEENSEHHHGQKPGK